MYAHHHKTKTPMILCSSKFWVCSKPVEQAKEQRAGPVSTLVKNFDGPANIFINFSFGSNLRAS